MSGGWGTTLSLMPGTHANLIFTTSVGGGYEQPLFQQWGNWAGEVPGWWVDISTLFIPLCHAVLISLLEVLFRTRGSAATLKFPSPSTASPSRDNSSKWTGSRTLAWRSPLIESSTLFPHFRGESGPPFLRETSTSPVLLDLCRLTTSHS